MNIVSKETDLDVTVLDEAIKVVESHRKFMSGESNVIEYDSKQVAKALNIVLKVAKTDGKSLGKVSLIIERWLDNAYDDNTALNNISTELYGLTILKNK